MGALIQPPGPAHFFLSYSFIDLPSVRAFALGAARAFAKLTGTALALRFEPGTALARDGLGTEPHRAFAGGKVRVRALAGSGATTSCP